MLDSWAQSAVPSGEDVAVTLHAGRVVQVVMTPEDLDMLRVAFGAVPHVFEHVTERLDSMPEGCGYLVYTQYDLKPFPTRHPPAVPELPQFTDGRWFAHDPRRATRRAYEARAKDDI